MNNPDAYTHGHHDSVLRSHRWRTVANSANYLLAELQPGMDLLDVGCGPGSITVELAELVAPGRVLGIDASEAVIAEASALATGSASASSTGATVEFRVGNAYALDLADDSVDVVHAHQVLQHLSDPVAALREWSRVCRPGGLIAARDADYAAFFWHPVEPLLERWLEIYRAAHRANSSEPDAGRHLLSWANAAGLHDVAPTASMWCYASPEDRTWWAGLWADRMTTSAVGAQAVSQGISTDAELEAIGMAWRAWATNDDAWFGVPHGEIIVRVQ